MDLSKFLQKDVYEIFSIILIVCDFDQVYMIMKYRNINKETLIITLFFTIICIYYGFIKKNV